MGHAQVSDRNVSFFDILIILVAVMVRLRFVWDKRWLKFATIGCIPVNSLEYIVPLNLLKRGSEARICDKYCLQ